MKRSDGQVRINHSFQLNRFVGFSFFFYAHLNSIFFHVLQCKAFRRIRNRKKKVFSSKVTKEERNRKSVELKQNSNTKKLIARRRKIPSNFVAFVSKHWRIWWKAQAKQRFNVQLNLKFMWNDSVGENDNAIFIWQHKSSTEQENTTKAKKKKERKSEKGKWTDKSGRSHRIRWITKKKKEWTRRKHSLNSNISIIIQFEPIILSSKVTLVDDWLSMAPIKSSDFSLYVFHSYSSRMEEKSSSLQRKLL